MLLYNLFLFFWLNLSLVLL